jgi:hypothetical protein
MYTTAVKDVNNLHNSLQSVNSNEGKNTHDIAETFRESKLFCAYLFESGENHQFHL